MPTSTALRRPFFPTIILAVLCLSSACATATGQQPLQRPQSQPPAQQERQQPRYAVRQSIPVSCLKRNIENGEHLEDDKGDLVYIPFPTCNETGKPLELAFGVEQDLNCTISFISDEFFHLLEFYVHNDAPLTCRIPARPLTPAVVVAGGAGEKNGQAAGDVSATTTAEAGRSGDYIPLIFALSGALQLSHLHIANHLNILLHAAPRSVAPGVVDSATAYSISPTTKNTRIIIGSALRLRLSVRWYPTTTLPSGWAGVGGHIFLSTVVYCLLSMAATAAACLAYFRAVELPRKLRRYGAERLGGDGGSAAMGFRGSASSGAGGPLGGYAYPASASASSSASGANGHAPGRGFGLGLNFGRGSGSGKLD